MNVYMHTLLRVNVYMYMLLRGVDMHRHIHSTPWSECALADSLCSME